MLVSGFVDISKHYMRSRARIWIPFGVVRSRIGVISTVVLVVAILVFALLSHISF